MFCKSTFSAPWRYKSPMYTRMSLLSTKRKSVYLSDSSNTFGSLSMAAFMFWLVYFAKLMIISLEKKRLNDSGGVWSLFACPRGSGVCFHMSSAPSCYNLVSSIWSSKFFYILTSKNFFRLARYVQIITFVHDLIKILEFLFSCSLFWYILRFIILVILFLIGFFDFRASRRFFRNNIIVILSLLLSSVSHSSSSSIL